VLDLELSTDRAATARAKVEAEWAVEEAREKQAAEQAANMAEKKTRKKKREKAERSKLSFSFGDEDEWLIIYYEDEWQQALLAYTTVHSIHVYNSSSLPSLIAFCQ
jgi:hypothetical protein